jgi:hypothetical protein
LEIGPPAGRRRRRRRWAPFSAGISLVILSSIVMVRPTLAQGVPATGKRTATVTPISEPMAIDGVLDEPAWRTAPPIGELVQRQPIEGDPPSERTTVTLLADRDRLYIGVVAYDAEPAKVLGTQMARDAGLGADDRIEILLDTFRDQRSAFYFATNPSGALVDGLLANGQLNTDWDAIWSVRTRRTDDGWVAEFAIPFKSLSFPAARSVWGFNVSRHVYRKLEENRWSGARLDSPFAQVAEAGEISGLVGMTQGIGLDVRPFLVGRWLRQELVSPTGERRAGDGVTTGKPGLDVFYNITPSLKLTATVNTDFGETEVDARQINLSRFSVLFPEKRAFFLQGAGVFSFASTGPEPAGGIPLHGADVFPFFSRQIGLYGDNEVPLDAGIKLTGTVGRTDIGVLDVRTGDLPIAEGLVEGKNFFVGRIKQNLFRQSYVGALVTDGDPAPGRSGQTYGFDTRLATSRFLGRPQNLVINAYAARSVNEGVSDRDWSYGFSASYPNDVYQAQIVVRDVQANFKPALGFVQRDNVRLLRTAFSWNPRPRDLLNIQQLNHDIYYTRFTRLDTGETESWDLYVTLLDWHFKSGDNLHGLFDFNPTYERLFEPFEISPGVHLQPGVYRFTRFRSNLLSTATKRRLSGNINFLYGGYWSGKAEQIIPSVTFKLPPRLIVTASANQTFARLPEGHFIARIYTGNVGYAVSPTLAFSSLMQYDNRSRNLGWQTRVRWTPQPGNDVFIAFNQGWIQEDLDGPVTGRIERRFRTQDTKLSAKIQYSLRF